MSPFAFDAAIAIGRHESIPHPDHSITRYHVDIQKRFNAGGAPFGGIIFAATLNALVSDFNGTRWPHPLSAQCTFLSIAQTAPAYVDVRRLKEGGRSAVSEAVLRQDQPTKSGGYETVDILSVVATFGDLRNEEGPEYVTGKRPEVEWDEQGLEWKPSPETPGVGMQFMVSRVTKLPPMAPGSPPTVLHASRFTDSRPTDLLSLAFWSDMFNSPVRRIPELQKLGFRGMSMDLNISFRGLPKGKTVYTKAWTTNLTRGRYDCNCEIWDEEGNLVVLATQTRMMRGLTGGWKMGVGETRKGKL